jgi:hypothetical protein
MAMSPDDPEWQPFIKSIRILSETERNVILWKDKEHSQERSIYVAELTLEVGFDKKTGYNFRANEKIAVPPLLPNSELRREIEKLLKLLENRPL